MCNVLKARADFWPGDLTNRFAKKSVLGRKACKPIPPSERWAHKRAAKATGAAASSKTNAG
eukprot:1559091-Karenia_brevis.AAC.1